MPENPDKAARAVLARMAGILGRQRRHDDYHAQIALDDVQIRTLAQSFVLGTLEGYDEQLLFGPLVSEAFEKGYRA